MFLPEGTLRLCWAAFAAKIPFGHVSIGILPLLSIANLASCGQLGVCRRITFGNAKTLRRKAVFPPPNEVPGKTERAAEIEPWGGEPFWIFKGPVNGSGYRFRATMAGQCGIGV